MSFVKTPAFTETNQHFLLNMVPNPTKKFTNDQSNAQRDVISQIRNAGKDLFQPNPAVKVDASGNLKSRQLYNRNVSINDLVTAMDKYDLVMQVNLKGGASKSAMVTSSQLQSSASVSSPSGTFAFVRHGNYVRGIDLL
jgi:hypothetical protein